jgi:carbon starvation protein CstA
LAALSLAGITVWLKITDRKWWITGVPAVFMTVITFISLLVIIKKSFAAGLGLDPVGITGILLLLLASYIVAAAGRAFFAPRAQVR